MGACMRMCLCVPVGVCMCVDMCMCACVPFCPGPDSLSPAPGLRAAAPAAGSSPHGASRWRLAAHGSPSPASAADWTRPHSARGSETYGLGKARERNYSVYDCFDDNGIRFHSVSHLQ